MVISSFYLAGTLMVFPQSNKDTLTGKAEIIDQYHYSSVLADSRTYRIFLPPDYKKETGKKYPVIYFFHGWAQRYFGSMGDGYANYDKGDENDGDTIEKFVSENEVIVVKIDGLNQFPNDPLNLAPYNISKVTTFRQFPTYFKELVGYIDGNYRTIPDRAHRAVSGLSMGGFMTFWLAAKFPDMLSAAGNFCGSTEFMAGPVEFSVRYAHAEAFDNFKGVRLRMHNGTRDRLRFYHQDMNRYLLNVVPQYEFKAYEAAHETCGLGDMFGFITQAFDAPLPLPAQWDYIDIFPFFEVWEYQVETSRNRAGFTIMENVDQKGFKIAVRNFLPDGELMPNVSVKVKTAPIYKKNQEYHITDFDVRSKVKNTYSVNSDSEGRLTIETNGSLHHMGISGNDESPNLGIANLSIDNLPWPETGKAIDLSIHVLNKGTGDANGITATLTPLSEGLEVLEGKGKLKTLPVLAMDGLKGKFRVKNNKPGVEIAKFKLVLQDESDHEWQEEFEFRFKDPVSEISDFEIADGREMTVVQAAKDSVTYTLGAGNGDGIANPGETIVVLAKESGKYLRTNAFTMHPQINADNTNIRVADSWQEYDHIGGAVKYSEPVISSEKSDGEAIWFYVEYWLPGDISGQHIIKKGKVRIDVKGADKTPPQIQWLQVLADDRIEARVYDGLHVDRVIVTFVPNKEKSTIDYVNWKKGIDRFEVELVDTGFEGDQVKGDGIYSRKIKNRPPYFYDLKIEMADTLGNNATLEWPETIFLKDTE